MLDTCPPHASCGTAIGIWTDATMPDDAGVIKSVTVKGSWNGNCAFINIFADVMKCPDGVFIYRHTSLNEDCSRGYCGMD